MRHIQDESYVEKSHLRAFLLVFFFQLEEVFLFEGRLDRVSASAAAGLASKHLVRSKAKKFPFDRPFSEPGEPLLDSFEEDLSES